MKKALLLSTLAIALSGPAFAGDPVAGQQKAGACIVCHGTTGYPGIFYTYQLAGRNADKLTVKTNKYRTGKILHPIMNLAVMPLTDKDVEDISAFYQSLKEPVRIPFVTIKGDDEEPAPAK
ncbi:MAG: c-type cytochrome [Thiobacillaceae bacterium]